ncbi:MAG: adenosine kinase [Baekduia sp.]
MTTTPHDVVGIGNALVDVLSHEDDAFLERFGMDKGAMTLIDTVRAEELYGAMSSGQEVSGGSAANTLAGIASFGGSAAFIGRVNRDGLGRVFEHDMSALGVRFVSLPNDEGEPTGRCLIVVTPDAQRTMNTYLGAAADLGVAELAPDVIASAKVTYLEGYLFDRDPARAAFHEAARIAHEAGGEVATTLSDSFCVTRHQDEWLRLIAEGTDVLFANEAEITTLYGTDFETAAAQVRDKVKIACLTRSEKGSVVLHGDETFEIAAVPVPEVLDTTGAGDLYAAGFLYGYTQGEQLARCGELGAIAAGAVIGHTGARPGVSLAQLVS